MPAATVATAKPRIVFVNTLAFLFFRRHASTLACANGLHHSVIIPSFCRNTAAELVQYFRLLKSLMTKGSPRLKKILFITGSINQTSQMHQIASELGDYDCYFSQLYSTNPVIKSAVRSGLLEGTVMGNKLRTVAEDYLRQHNLRNDYAASVYKNQYDLAVFCTDMVVDKRLRKLKTVWVQEGMTDPVTTLGRLVHRLGLPSYLGGNTAFNGCSNIADIYCAASEGYKKQFAENGTDARKIFVTGIPNYDNIETARANDFPHSGYVLVATSDIREAYNRDNREAFIAQCVKIAAGRPLIFKLHPNEIKERAIAEIKKFAPADTLIFTEGNTAHMIANCEELITQYSTVVYTGIVLGKRVHSYFDLGELYGRVPLQNGGHSAAAIAQIIRDYIEYAGPKSEFTKAYQTAQTEYA